MRAPSAKITRRSMIGIILVVLIAVLFNYIQTWRKRADFTAKTPPILPSEVKRSAEIFDFSENYEGVTRYKIHARKLTDMAGKSLLQDITVYDLNSDGSVRNEIRSRLAEYDQVRKTVDFSGDVRLFLRRQLEVRMDSLHYDFNSSIGETPDLLRFLSDQLSGTARGIRLDQKQQSLDLHSEVDLELVQKRNAKTEKLHATSDRAYFSDSSNRILFQGKAVLKSSAQSLSADNIEAQLDEEKKHLTSLTASGNAAYQSDAPGETWNMNGNWIGFGVSPSGTLRSLSVLGRGSFSFTSSSKEDLTLGGDEIHVQFDAGQNPTQVQARKDTSFQTKHGEREIRAYGDLFTADFATGTKDIQKIQILRQAKMIVEPTPELEGTELNGDEIRMALHKVKDRSVLTKLNAEGSARYVSKPATKREKKPGLERSLSAARLELLQPGEGDYFESGSASGKVTISEELKDPSARQQMKKLLAETAHFTFFEGTSRLRDLNAEQEVQVIYETKDLSGKKPASENFKTYSNRMKAVFEPITGAIKSISQWDNFRYEDGTRSASSGRCDYDSGAERLVMTESVPKISDENQSTTGSRIEYDRRQKLLQVHGRVRSVVSAQKGSKSFFGGSSSSSAGTVTADEMSYWTETRRARYTGKVHSQSENQKLRADVLEISEGFEQVDAEGSIQHIIVKEKSQSAAPQAKKAKDPNAPDLLTTIRSSSMSYSQKQNTIRYSGKVTLHSKDDDQDVDLSSDTLDAVPDPGGNEVQQIHAEGKVSIRIGARTFKGDAADYSTATKKLAVSGKPAVVDDPGQVGLSARQLTYSGADDTILLENGAGK